MPRGQDLGARSRVDPAGRIPTKTPRTKMDIPRFRATYTRDCSPHGPGGYYRKSRRGRR